jgi:amino acid permease
LIAWIGFALQAMIGAGVLGLPYAFSYLGWIGGIIFLVFSFWVSWHTYKLLVYMHEVPDLDNKAGGGIRRLDRYDQLAEYILGKRKGKLVLMPFQLAVLVGIAITYTVVGGDNLAAFAKGVSPANANFGNWAYFLMFGGLQMALSMLPNFDDIRFVSLLGALMSFAYCLIAMVMSATVIRPGTVTYDPVKLNRSTLDTVMGIFNAMTTIFFAYGGHNVALEIQATIPVPADGKHGHSTVPIMMRGKGASFSTCTQLLWWSLY